MTRGRPPEFDETEVLDTAAALFMRDGFEAVSVATVCRETGLAMQSLYHRFGDKAGLHREALKRYGVTHNEPSLTLLSGEGDPLAAIRSFIRGWRRHAGAGRDGGCLFAQTLSRGDRDDPAGHSVIARDWTDRLRKALIAALRRAAAAGELPVDRDPVAVADGVLALHVGVAVLGRGGLPSAVIDHAIATALQLIDSED